MIQPGDQLTIAKEKKVNVIWKRLILAFAVPVAMALMSPAHAILFMVDDFNSNAFFDCEDPSSAPDFCDPTKTPITGGNTVWNTPSGGPGVERTIDANLLAGDRVATEICNNCQAAHLVADAGVTPAVGEYSFVWTGPAVNLSGGTLLFDWGADLAGTTWFADFGDIAGNVIDSILQAALPATPGPGSLTHEASLSLSSVAGVDFSNITQISLHFNGVGGLDANIDNVRVSVPEPGIIALLCFGLLGLGFTQRKMKA